MTTYNRMTLADRIIIHTQIELHSSFASIALSINRNATSIAREVKNYAVPLNTFGLGRNVKNRCIHRIDCKRQGLCAGMTFKCRNRYCSRCAKQNCSQNCPDYEEEHCSKLNNPPYVCNGCPTKSRCPLMKKIYDARQANEAALSKRTESRSGLNMTEEELAEFDSLISARLKKGQSVHHIFTSSPGIFSISEKQAYNLIKNGLVKAKPIDLPRMIRMKPRVRKSKELKVDKNCRIGRTYDDYQNYLNAHPDEAVLQGDTVEGVKGGKCILTLTWASWDFQLGFLRDHNNSASVTAIVDHLYELLGEELFHQVFPSVWLLDNGAEFSDPKEIEKYGILVFYCDPSAPYQKGACENTHEHFRRICPKGTSFNDFTQEQIDLIFSQTNSIYRKKLNDHCPYDLFSHLCASGIDVKKIFNISWVDPKAVELTPSLLSGFRRSLDKNKL